MKPDSPYIFLAARPSIPATRARPDLLEHSVEQALHLAKCLHEHHDLWPRLWVFGLLRAAVEVQYPAVEYEWHAMPWAGLRSRLFVYTISRLRGRQTHKIL